MAEGPELGALIWKSRGREANETIEEPQKKDGYELS